MRFPSPRGLIGPRVCLRLGLSALSIDRARIEGLGKLLNDLAELSPARQEGADESSAMESMRTKR